MSDIKYFKNNITADLYIGQGAGKKFLQELENAEKSIKIVSPYLSPIFIEKLIYLHNKGVKVTLITSDEIEDYKNVSTKRIITRLIRQVRHIDEKAQLERMRLTKLRIWLIVMLIISVIGNFMTNMSNYPLIVASLILLVISVTVSLRINNVRIYNYSYEQLFPFKVYVSPYNKKYKGFSSFFIHSKIYVIDNMVAYLGSLNYTKSGLENNFETRVRISSDSVVKDLSNLVDELFNNNEENGYLNIQSWGKELYKEPIN